jgi:hypothetical protein
MGSGNMDVLTSFHNNPAALCRSGFFIYFFRLRTALMVVHASLYCKYIYTTSFWPKWPSSSVRVLQWGSYATTATATDALWVGTSYNNAHIQFYGFLAEFASCSSVWEFFGVLATSTVPWSMIGHYETCTPKVGKLGWSKQCNKKGVNNNQSCT